MVTNTRNATMAAAPGAAMFVCAATCCKGVKIQSALGLALVCKVQLRFDGLLIALWQPVVLV